MAAYRQRHRGAHPDDRRLFGPRALETLRRAVGDLSVLLEWGYAMDASLALVGDRFQLTTRQRLAVRRAACSDRALSDRISRRVPAGSIEINALAIDGFNLIIAAESAISGGVLLRCRDGCLRDMASIHGSYRSVTETDAAVVHIGACLAALRPRSVVWLLDRPVSNSGRLRRRLEEAAEREGWPWSVRLEFNPDRELIASREIVATSDGVILDAPVEWVNLAAHVIARLDREVWVVDLSGNAGARFGPTGGVRRS
jgi:hypothetical protein